MKSHLHIEIDWSLVSNSTRAGKVPTNHQEELQDRGMRRAMEMASKGFREGELSETINDINYRGYWKFEFLDYSNPIKVVVAKSMEDAGFDVACSNTDLPIEVAVMEEDMCGEGTIAKVDGLDYSVWQCFPERNDEIANKVII